MSKGVLNSAIALACLLLWQVAFATSAAGAEGWPRTIAHAAGTTSLAAKPTQIVSTSPSLTGILLAIDAPLVASAATTRSSITDDSGFFSQWADVARERKVEVLYSNLSFDIEAIIGSAPDLIIGSSTGADSILQYAPQLTAQNLPVVIVDYSNRSWQEVARELGKATGLEDKADAAIKSFDQYVAKVAGTIPPQKGTATIIGYNLAGSYSISKPQSAQGQLLTSLGITVIGLPESMRSKVLRSSDFDFISHENLSAAATADTLYLLNATENEVRTFMRDPSLANLPAVKAKRVFALGKSSFRIDYYSGREMIDLVATQLKQ